MINSYSPFPLARHSSPDMYEQLLFTPNQCLYTKVSSAATLRSAAVCTHHWYHPNASNRPNPHYLFLHPSLQLLFSIPSRQAKPQDMVAAMHTQIKSNRVNPSTHPSPPLQNQRALKNISNNFNKKRKKNYSRGIHFVPTQQIKQKNFAVVTPVSGQKKNRTSIGLGWT